LFLIHLGAVHSREDAAAELQEDAFAAHVCDRKGRGAWQLQTANARTARSDATIFLARLSDLVHFLLAKRTHAG
jgi:hypothetical protein